MTGPPPPHETELAPRKLGPEALHALAIFACGLVALLAWLPDREYGDGPRYISMLSAYGFAPESRVHWAYVPSAHLYRQALSLLGIDLLPGLALQSFSAVCVALGLSGSWLLMRLVGASRLGAWSCVALFGIGPVLQFYGRVAEVHALHFAASAWFFAALVAIGRRGPLAAALVVTLGSPWLFLTHDSGGLLFVGVAFFALFACGQRVSLKAIVGWGAIAGVGLAAGITVAAAQRGLGPLELLSGTSGLVTGDTRPLRIVGLWTDLVQPIALAWLLVAIGLGTAWSHQRRLAMAVLGLALPAVGFFTWWAIPEHGAYMLGYMPGLIALGGLGASQFIKRCGTRKALSIGTLLLALQLAMTSQLLHDFAHDYDAEFQTTRDRDHAEAFAQDHARIVITLDATKQTPSALHDRTYEYRLLHPVLQAIRADLPPAQVVGILQSAVGAIGGMATDANATLYYDRSHWRNMESTPELEPYASSIEAALGGAFEIEILASGEVWRLKAR